MACVHGAVRLHGACAVVSAHKSAHIVPCAHGVVCAHIVVCGTAWCVHGVVCARRAKACMQCRYAWSPSKYVTYRRSAGIRYTSVSSCHAQRIASSLK